MVAFEIELGETERAEVGHPEALVVDDDVEGEGEASERLHEVDRCRIGCRSEHVDAATGAIQGENQTLGSDRQGVHAVELARAFAEAAELRDVVRVAVKDHHPVIVQAVGHQNPAVGQKRHVLWPREVLRILSRNILLAQRLQQLAAVVGEDVDLMERLVDQPHAVFGVVWADAQPMGSRSGRALAQGIPLRPALFDVAVTIERVEAVEPDTAFSGVEHVDPDRARVAGKLGRNRRGQSGLPTLRDEDAVRRFSEHARVAAERETGLGERLVPGPDDVVGARADGARNHGLTEQSRCARDQHQQCRSRRHGSRHHGRPSGLLHRHILPRSGERA